MEHTKGAWRVRHRFAFDDETGERLYWSNSDGWVSRDTGDYLGKEEMASLNLPVDGEWVGANLYDAAPEMRELVKELAEHHPDGHCPIEDDDRDSGCVVCEARAILKRLEG